MAPANTATKPIPASRPKGSGINNDNALPKVAPIKNKGVTSPPLNPAESVIMVKIIFKAKSYNGSCFSNDSTIIGTPNPIYRVVPMIRTAKTMIVPPTTGRRGGYVILDLKIAPAQ